MQFIWKFDVGIGKTVKEKVCVHTSRDIRSIASQLVNMWIEVFRKEKATNGGLKLLRDMSNVDSSKAKAKSLGSRKPPIHVQHYAAGRVNANSKKQTVKHVKLETTTGSKPDAQLSGSQVLNITSGNKFVETEPVELSKEEKAALAAAEAARAAAAAAAEVCYLFPCNTFF